MNLKQQNCNVPGCEEVHSAKGLCNRHYGRAKHRKLLNQSFSVAELAEKVKTGRPRRYIKKVSIKEMVTFKKKEKPPEVLFAWDEPSTLI